jgi:nucleotide-binding universal stress UspA family protein
VLADGPAQALRRSLALDARRYLDGVASGVRQRGAAVETGVVFGPVAESIVQWAQDNGGDLIALMSHGLGRSARWVFGSVADRLLQSSPVPILVVRASKEVLDAQEEYEEAQMDAKLLETLQAN